MFFYALLPPESCKFKLPEAPRTYKVMNHLLKIEVLYIISYDRLKEYNDILFFVVVKFPDSKKIPTLRDKNFKLLLNP